MGPYDSHCSLDLPCATSGTFAIEAVSEPEVGGDPPMPLPVAHLRAGWWSRLRAHARHCFRGIR